MTRSFLVVSAVAMASAQQAGSLTAEKQPALSTMTCTKAAGCTSKQQAVTIDANWRWTHQVGQPKNCYTGNSWDKTLCPDPVTCAKNCALEGAGSEYANTYGVIANGNTLQLNFVTQGQYSKNVGSRTYLMEDEHTYQLFKLKNREFTFTVDDSQLPCGLNGALYFVQMDADGGMSKFPGNLAGAKYGTGYCDAQCPRDIKYINGEANILDWSPEGSDTGVGKYGSCCTEMDIWEANSISTAYTPHACSVDGQTRCETATDCGEDDHRYDGVCDKNGCDMQTFRLGNKTFWGPGSNFIVDSTKPVTVVTQFITSDNTDNGELVEIRRKYVQNGHVTDTPAVMVGAQSFDSVSDAFCKAESSLFADNTTFIQKGGLNAMGKAAEAGMVLVMSLWDDHDVQMLWLDSDYPTDQPTDKPGVARGTCPTTSGVPADVERDSPNSHVVFSDIRFGEIGSTYGH